jgi:vacuolar protein sorting-associated protein 13A/C
MNPVSWVLSYVASKYLRNFITEIENEQVQVGIWRGDVTLDNINLNKIDLPSRLFATGSIGELNLQIPWRTI